ncbi:hypothetical protein FKM82_024834 [Ascaphus truei]
MSPLPSCSVYPGAVSWNVCLRQVHRPNRLLLTAPNNTPLIPPRIIRLSPLLSLLNPTDCEFPVSAQCCRHDDMTYRLYLYPAPIQNLPLGG